MPPSQTTILDAELATVRLPKKQLDALISHHWHAGYPSASSGPFSAWHREAYEALAGREWSEDGPETGVEVGP